MPRRFFRHVSSGYLRKKRPVYLKPLDALLAHPTFLSVSRRSVAGAIWIGLFVALLPLPGQTLIAFALALALRVNVPIAALTTWVTNPITIGPIFYYEYTLGRLILDIPPQPFTIDLSWEWVTKSLHTIGEPLLLGCFITATIVASSTYVLVSVLWRLTIAGRFKRRHQRP